MTSITKKITSRHGITIDNLKTDAMRKLVEISSKSDHDENNALLRLIEFQWKRNQGATARERKLPDSSKVKKGAALILACEDQDDLYRASHLLRDNVTNAHARAARKFSEGDRVEFDHADQHGEGIVFRVNDSSLVIIEDNEEWEWVVDAGIVSKVA